MKKETNIIAIKLVATRNEKQDVLIEMWAEKTSTGYQRTFTDYQVESKIGYLKSQIREYVSNFSDFKIKMVSMETTTLDMSSSEKEARTTKQQFERANGVQA